MVSVIFRLDVNATEPLCDNFFGPNLYTAVAVQVLLNPRP